MTILGRSIRSTESRGLLARISRSKRLQASRRGPSAELVGVITLVPVVDHDALRALIDGNPRR